MAVRIWTMVEAAPTGRGSCKICNEKIAKGALRVISSGELHHPACAVKEGLSLAKFFRPDGINLLSDEEKAAVRTECGPLDSGKGAPPSSSSSSSSSSESDDDDASSGASSSESSDDSASSASTRSEDDSVGRRLFDSLAQRQETCRDQP